VLARFSGPGKKRLQQALGFVLRELAALLRAGVPLMRALQLAADSNSEPAIRSMLQRISRDLDNGHTLVAAAEREHRLTGLLTSYDVAMLQVGEQTGRLPEAFAELFRHREFARSTNEQVGAALRYPAFVILTCLMAVVIVNLWVIPSFAKVFAQARAELPLLTQVLLGMSKLMLNWWPAGLALVAGSTFGWTRFLGTERGRLWWDRHKLRLPIVGRILEGIVLARLSASLSSSMQAGLTISDALQVTARTLGNAWYESRVQQMCRDLARGASITAAARNMAVLPPTMLQLFAIGEESGSLEELMREISVHYQSEVDYSVKRLSATLEPILIWFLGIGVLVLALGVFMPMWDLGRATMK
jgi:MSHA biogenesis protein MshG